MIYIYITLVALFVCSFVAHSLVKVMEFISNENEHYEKMSDIRFRALLKMLGLEIEGE